MTTAPYSARLRPTYHRDILRSGIRLQLIATRPKMTLSGCSMRLISIVPILMFSAADKPVSGKSILSLQNANKMEPALQRRIQRYGWDKASVYYETFWQEQLKPAQGLLLDMAD